ncbi:MAG: SMP-30/gluconolactonase/LRE family protein [Pseudomonadota bacterium]
MTHARRIEADLWTRLPETHRWTGRGNAWTEATRPGVRLHSFLEGPAILPSGDVLVADVAYGRIFRVTPNGTWSLAAEGGRPHALRPLADGRFAVADFEQGLVALDLATGNREVLADRVNTEAFRGLSDLAVAPNGDIWFTDSGRSSLTDPTGRLFCLRADGRLERVLANAPYPNGVALSPDGGTVYVAMTRANAVWTVSAAPAGPMGAMAGVFLQLSGGLGPDGLAVDAAGRLAVAQARAGRAYLFDALGDPVAEIRTPGGTWTTAVAFDGDTLLIVEAEDGAIWRADVAGLRAE